MNRTIEVTITPDGKTRVATKGFAGGECRQASEFIEQALGKQTSEQLTAEYYQQAKQPQRLREQG